MLNGYRLRPSAIKRNPLEYRDDWNAWIRDILGVRLDRKQRDIVDSVQFNRRTSVRSGHSRGKDYSAACISLAFLFNHYPSKVINTAPTGRQVNSIMMSEIGKLHRNARVPLGGELLSGLIRMNTEDWFLIGFKAGDKETEAWTGFHSPNILVVVTEASGIAQETFDAIDGVLTGTLSRALIVFNPNRTIGEAFQSARSPLYAKHKLSCLQAPNVRARRILIPGQVDYEWVAEKLQKPGWVTRISAEEADPVGFHDFRFEGQWYRPGDLFLVKVMGEFPREGEDQLFPLSWIEAANQRWLDIKPESADGELLLGCDIAGMGRDVTVFAPRRQDYIAQLQVFSKADHMVSAGRIKNEIAHDGTAFIDTIGEGAGVHSRLAEQEVHSVSAKFSESAEGVKDATGEREFLNMRAACYWLLRDALDPRLGGNLALPPDDELTQELTEIHWTVQSNGKIKIEPKEDIKARIGRSPDKSDAVALTYWPYRAGQWDGISVKNKR